VLSLVVVVFSFVSISQVFGWEGWVFCTSQEIGCKDRLWTDLYSVLSGNTTTSTRC